ncbi:uncharacterized protein LOC132804042 [Ziziphus jujuba]|uniref:Uncharacterized protein LOC132804042 n=1 Tax=Ziziphus jujuba TaxID=326968 RepID=A0ABM4AB07_ZIZJJ|nr:uncharacterized protein LOC132804042 [Ziziphus jujuba]
MESSSGKVDPAWSHCIPIEGNKYGIICKYCNHKMQSDGMTRLKYHLAHSDPKSNVKKCPNVPPEVKKEIYHYLRKKEHAKLKKKTMEEDIRNELRDMHLDERDSYKAAVRASKQDRWEEEQGRNFVNPRGQGSGSSREGGSQPCAQFRRATSVREPIRRQQSQQFSPVALAPSLYKSSGAKQKNIKDVLTKGGLKNTLGRLVAKFFIYDNVSPAKAKSHHFKNMIVGAQQSGMGVQIPSPYEIKEKYLDIEYKEMQQHIEKFKESWKTYGCTIMCDGWTESTKLSILNFMVVTDNGSAFVKAGKKLMTQYNLYWTPCAAHCIDLIFEDIGKHENICKGDIVRLGATRFATNYIALNSLLKKKASLKQVFTSDAWAEHQLSQTKAAYFLNPRFQYKEGIGTDSDLVQAVHDVFAALYPNSDRISQFGNEII